MAGFADLPIAPPAAPQPQGNGGILHSLFNGLVMAPAKTIGGGLSDLPNIGSSIGYLGKLAAGEITGNKKAVQNATQHQADLLKNTNFMKNYTDPNLEKGLGKAGSQISNLLPFTPELRGAELASKVPLVGRIPAVAKGVAKSRDLSNAPLKLSGLARQGGKIGAIAGGSQAMANGGNEDQVGEGALFGGATGALGAGLTGGILKGLTKGRAFPDTGAVASEGAGPTGGGSKIGNFFTGGGTDMRARAGGYGIGEGPSGRDLGFYDSAMIDKNLEDNGIRSGSPDARLKQVEDKMYTTTQAVDKILQTHNAHVDSNALATEYLATIRQQSAVSPAVLKAAENFAGNLRAQVSDVKSLVNFRRGLDRQANNFARNPDSKMAADQIASTVLREVANDHTNAALPELAQANQVYHQMAKASDFLRGGSKVLSDMSQSGGGLYSRMVTGKTAQGAKSFAGAGMQRLGKMLGGQVPGEVAQSRAAQAVAALPEDHPALYTPGEPRVVTEQVSYPNAVDMRPGAQQAVDQATPRVVNRVTPADALNLRQPAQQRVDEATPLNVRVGTPQGGAVGGMDGIAPADARIPAQAAQTAAQAIPTPNSVDALAQPRVPSGATPIDLRQANVPTQVPNPGTPVDLRQQPVEQVPTQVPSNVPPVDLRGTPTQNVQRIVPGEPVPVEPPPPPPPPTAASASPFGAPGFARAASLDVARQNGDMTGNLLSGGMQLPNQQQADTSGSGAVGADTTAIGGDTVQQDQSPYPLQNLEADMTRDPKNSSTYMALYKMLNPNGNLSATMQRDLANINSAQNISKQLYNAYQQAGGGEGRIPGAISNLLGRAGADNNVQVYNSVRAGSASKIARALGETGVLTDQDIARALGYLPQVTDNPDEAAKKMAFLDSVIAGAEQSVRDRASGSQTADTSQLQGVGQ